MKEYNSETISQQNEVASVFKSINLMSVGVATLLSAGMVIDKHSVTVSVLSGVGFYSAIAGLLIIAPHAANIILNHQDQVTIRRRDELPYRMVDMAHSRGISVVDPLPLPYAESAQLPQMPSFVPAVPRIADNLKVVAGSWVTQLFDTTTGRPLPSRITRNKGQVQMKSPESEVVEYLESLGIVSQDAGKHLYFNVTHFPTLRDALNSIRTGVRKPSLEEGWEGGEGGLL